MERELIQVPKAKEKTIIGVLGKLSLRNSIAVLIGFLIASTTMFDNVSPFAAAYTASLSGFECISAFLGCIIGFFLKGDLLESIAAVSSLLSIVTVRMFLSNKRGRWVDFFSAGVTGISVCVTHFITAQKVSDMLIIISLSLSAAIGNLVLLQFQRLIEKRVTTNFANPINFITIALTYIIAISVFSNFYLGIFNLGIITSGVVILWASVRYGYGLGTACGVLSAFGIVLATGDFSIIALILGLSGMIAGIFAKSGKLSATSAFILASSLCGAVLGMNDTTLSVMGNVFAGGAVFMAIPYNIIGISSKEKPTHKQNTDLQAIFAQRLKFAEGAISDVRETVNKTAKSLDHNTNHDISWVYNSACDKICRRCRMNMVCWGDDYNDNIKYFNGLMKNLRKGDTANSADLPRKLSERCHNKEKLIAQVNTQYREFVSTSNANRKISEMRNILTTQLSSTEKLLDKLSEQLVSDEKYDNPSSQLVVKALEDCGCENPLVSVITGDNKKIRVEAFSKTGFFCKPEELCEIISKVLQRDFELPDIIKTNNTYRLTMFERATYYIELENYQISKLEGKVCGDYVDSFVDGFGNAYIILSDGMGSGGRARVDSAFACGMLIKLLQSGVGIDAGISIINLSLMVKSRDESFATLDICKLDLYSGKAELYKAGSAGTYIKCGNSTAKLPGKGLPVGVCDKVVYDKQCFTLGADDVVIMTSDGAEVNEKWIFREMQKDDITVKELSQGVAKNAKFSSDTSKSDDISVIAFRLKK